MTRKQRIQEIKDEAELVKEQDRMVWRVIGLVIVFFVGFIAARIVL